MSKENGAKIECNVESTSSGNTRQNANERDARTGAFSIAPRLLSDKQSAHYLGCSRTTIREYVKHGLLKCTRLKHPSGIGFLHLFRIDVCELDRFVERMNANGEKQK